MIGVYTIVTVFTVGFISSTVAVSECNDTIIASLREIPECYTNGKPPQLTENKIKNFLWYKYSISNEKFSESIREVENNLNKVCTKKALNSLGTHVLISAGELPPDTRCVTAIQRPGSSDVCIHLKNGGNISYTANQVPRSDLYLEETGPAFPQCARYRLYIIHNVDWAYSYYRCTEGPIGSTGTPMVDVAVACSHLHDPKTLAVVDKAAKCFRALGINNADSLTPCNC